MHRKRTINELRELAWSQRLRSELLGEVVSRAERAGIRDCTDRSFLAGIGEFLLNELVPGDMYPHKKDGGRPKKNPRRKSKDHDPVQLSNILQAVQRSRSTGGTWEDAFDAARKLGYRGTLPRLMRLARNASEQKKVKTNDRGLLGSEYTPMQVSKICAVVAACRARGGKWSETLEAARGAGYAGGLQYLVKMTRNAGVDLKKRNGERTH